MAYLITLSVADYVVSNEWTAKDWDEAVMTALSSHLPGGGDEKPRTASVPAKIRTEHLYTAKSGNFVEDWISVLGIW
jgi:hypothetical protein